jgi:zinc protease
VFSDYSVTTPERMQALAAQYLRPEKSWRLAVLPQAGDDGSAPPVSAAR